MFSQALQRQISSPYGLQNDVATAELNAALRAMPGYPDTAPADIRAAAARGSIDARYIIQRAEDGDQEARDWLAM